MCILLEQTPVTLAPATAPTISCLPLDKKQLSRPKTKTYRTIRVSWGGSEEAYLLKSSVRSPEVYILKYQLVH